MLTKIKSAAPVQTFGSAGEDIISNAKVCEHLGTTHGCINLVQTHLEKRKQDPSFSSTAHDLNSALDIREQDPLSHLASHSAALERPPPERDKLTTSADLITSYLLAKAKRQSIKRGILITHQEGTNYLVSKGYAAMSSKYLSNNPISVSSNNY